MNRVRGVSLVELMISLLVSALVIAVVLNVFFATGVTARQNDATGRLQQSARLAFQRIERDIRMATFRHCVGFPDEPTGLVAGPTVVNLSTVPGDWRAYDNGGGAPIALPPEAFVSIHHCEGGSCSPALPDAVGGVAVPAVGTGPGQRAGDSDVVIVRYFGGEGVPLTDAMRDQRDNVSFDAARAAAAGWSSKTGSEYLVADCRGGDVFVGTRVGDALKHDAGNRTRALSRTYEPSAFTRLYRFPEDVTQRIYYVGYRADPESPDKLIGGLWTNQNGEMLELFTGIDRLQVRALTARGDAFGVVAPGAAASAGAQAMRRIDLALLVNGVVEASLREEPFVFAGATVNSSELATGGDRRPRREVTWSMDLRNL